MIKNHVVTIEEVRELSDELVSYRLRCDGEPLTDTWHTVSVKVPNHAGELAQRKVEVAQLHEAKLKWRATQQTPSAGTSDSATQT